MNNDANFSQDHVFRFIETQLKQYLNEQQEDFSSNLLWLLLYILLIIMSQLVGPKIVSIILAILLVFISPQINWQTMIQIMIYHLMNYLVNEIITRIRNSIDSRYGVMIKVKLYYDLIYQTLKDLMKELFLKKLKEAIEDIFLILFGFRESTIAKWRNYALLVVLIPCTLIYKLTIKQHPDEILCEHKQCYSCHHSRTYYLSSLDQIPLHSKMVQIQRVELSRS